METVPCAVVISIHAPREGSDDVEHPYNMCGGISIHAPREGSDVTAQLGNTIANLFQSTLPVRGATSAADVGAVPTSNFNPRSP